MTAPRLRSVLLAALVALCLPGTAHAHVIEGVGDFYAGMLHPVTSLASLLPWIALALLAGQQQRDAALLALAVFPVALVAGACIGLLTGVPGFVTTVDLVSILVLGGLVALGRPMPRPAMGALAALVGVVQGLANGAEVTASMSAWRFVPGVAVCAVLLMTCGIGLVRSLEKPWTRTAVRVAGSWIAAIGVMVLAFAL